MGTTNVGYEKRHENEYVARTYCSEDTHLFKNTVVHEK